MIGRGWGHYEPLLAGAYHVAYPYPLRNPTRPDPEAALAFSLAQLDELFATVVYPEDVACIVVEPILGEGGYVLPPDGFLPALRALADRHGILLVVDEVQTGFGRTGRFFATEWTAARPDVVVMGKGIASGLPLSGILAPRRLLAAWAPGAHGGTYGGNAVACAAALATLDVIDDEGLVANAERQGRRLLSALRALAADHPRLAEVRGRGLMIGLELADPDTLAPGLTWPGRSSPRRWRAICCSSARGPGDRWSGSSRRSRRPTTRSIGRRRSSARRWRQPVPEPRGAGSRRSEVADG